VAVKDIRFRLVTVVEISSRFENFVEIISAGTLSKRAQISMGGGGVKRRMERSKRK